MAEVKTSVDAIQIDYECDVCGDGNLIYDGSPKREEFQDYYHECSHCRYTQYFDTTYPYVRSIIKYIEG